VTNVVFRGVVGFIKDQCESSLLALMDAPGMGKVLEGVVWA